ncbi:MAG: c-type cytochrome [Arenicella sp.]|nr:c-type cytochrome [Arenicella sp.]
MASAALASNGDNQQANDRLPFNIDLDLQPTEVGWLDKRQHQVNRRAWTVFSSLMGYEPKQAASSQKKVRRWETWKEESEVFRPGGKAPDAWGVSNTSPTACGANPEEELLHLHRDEKVDDKLDAANQAVKADGTLPGTLTDQYEKVVRYEIRMNRKSFDYVVDQQLYNGETQAQANAVNFPNGSMIIKAAWRELTTKTSKHDRQRFMTRQACICPEKLSSEDKPTACHRAEVALVGFHIMEKQIAAPQWLWFTFEHNANVLPTHGLPASFSNATCEGEYCEANTQTPSGTPNQVTRLLPISESLNNLNRQQSTIHEKHNPVLTHYSLVGAQWPLPKSGKDQLEKTVFEVQPPFSANTTMETFAQESSSCMGCHAMARTLKPDEFVSSDFSFTVNNAEPRPDKATCDAYSYSNSISCSDETIVFDVNASLSSYSPAQVAKIRRGYSLSSLTYEQLPNNVGNKLHCRSCHLHAGGAPKASWWVGLRSLDKYKTNAKLQDRVNKCFTHSMNGSKLCETGTSGAEGSCTSNGDMLAITAYMDWLTRAYELKNECSFTAIDEGSQCKVQHGFPDLTSKTKSGSKGQGKKIFEQKCAFCHQKDGEGRYANNTYFRPALWGDNSYPKNAGMADPKPNQHNLANFLRWNMPYGSGGLLTDQEASDIASYINSRRRPEGRGED